MLAYAKFLTLCITIIVVNVSDYCAPFFGCSCVQRMSTPPLSPTQPDIPSDGTSRKIRQSTRLIKLTARSLDQP